METGAPLGESPCTEAQAHHGACSHPKLKHPWRTRMPMVSGVDAMLHASWCSYLRRPCPGNPALTARTLTPDS